MASKHIYDCITVIFDSNHVNDEIYLYQVETEKELTIAENPISDYLKDNTGIIRGQCPKGQKIYIVPERLNGYIKAYVVNDVKGTAKDDNLEYFFTQLFYDLQDAIDDYTLDYAMVHTYESIKYLNLTLDKIREGYENFFIYLWHRDYSLEKPILYHEGNYTQLFDLYYNHHKKKDYNQNLLE